MRLATFLFCNSNLRIKLIRHDLHTHCVLKICLPATPKGQYHNNMNQLLANLMYSIRTTRSCILFIIAMTLPSLSLSAARESASHASCGSNVSVVRSGDDWSLNVNGQPFPVHGAGMGYTDAAGISSLADAGGNAFRTWGTKDLDAQLAAAERLGLKVLVGLDMQKELQGFDYDDSDALQ